MRNLHKPNPNNVFQNRCMPVPPPHFEYTEYDMMYNMELAIHDWIYHNLKGRFYIGKSLSKSQQTCMKIGFEDGKELSYFTLACPLLKYK